MLAPAAAVAAGANVLVSTADVCLPHRFTNDRRPSLFLNPFVAYFASISITMGKVDGQHEAKQ